MILNFVDKRFVIFIGKRFGEDPKIAHISYCLGKPFVLFFS